MSQMDADSDQSSQIRNSTVFDSHNMPPINVVPELWDAGLMRAPMLVLSWDELRELRGEPECPR